MVSPVTGPRELHIETGEYERARELALASLGLARKQGERRVEIDANNALGTVARLLGDLATALRHHGDALRLAGEAGYRQGETMALTGLALDQSDLGCYDEARGTAERAPGQSRAERLLRIVAVPGS